MAAKRIVIACCALSFLQTSFAGFERFWIFSKDADTQISETWETLSEEEQLALIKRYQNLKEIQFEEEFCQLPDSEKQKMRETWQKMSTQERRELGQRLQQATPEQRPLIRQEYILKYQQPAMSHYFLSLHG